MRERLRNSLPLAEREIHWNRSLSTSKTEDTGCHKLRRGFEFVDCATELSLGRSGSFHALRTDPMYVAINSCDKHWASFEISLLFHILTTFQTISKNSCFNILPLALIRISIPHSSSTIEESIQTVPICSYPPTSRSPTWSHTKTRRNSWVSTLCV